jgi:hypothetical protein
MLVPDSGGDMWIVMYVAIIASLSAMGLAVLPSVNRDLTPDNEV